MCFLHSLISYISILLYCNSSTLDMPFWYENLIDWYKYVCLSGEQRPHRQCITLYMWVCFGNCADPLALINVVHSQSNPERRMGYSPNLSQCYTCRSSNTLRAQDISRHVWWSSRKFRIFLSSVGLLNLRSLISRYRRFQSCKSTR